MGRENRQSRDPRMVSTVERNLSGAVYGPCAITESNDYLHPIGIC
jgi:hypothetical protein